MNLTLLINIPVHPKHSSKLELSVVQGSYKKTTYVRATDIGEYRSSECLKDRLAEPHTAF